MPPAVPEQLLEPSLVARLSGLRLSTRRRVTGRYSGGHSSKRFGSSMEFADYREYVAGDDPRRLDINAYRRLGKLLVKLTEAEDEAPLRIVVDQSASMAFGSKGRRARELAAALTVLATGGQDPVRVLLAGTPTNARTVDAGPWMRGRNALGIVSKRLLDNALPAMDPDGEGPDGEVAGASGQPENGDGGDAIEVVAADPTGALVPALRRAHGEGARGPVVLISDLLFAGFDEVLRALAGRGGDAVLVHLVGREDMDPTLRGDLRLVDAETGTDVEVSVDERTIRDYLAARDRWLDEIHETAGRHGITVIRVVDDAHLQDVLLTDLRAAGVVV